MDKKYVHLFKEIAHATEVMAEKVVEANRIKKDEKGEQTAKIMHDDYIKLYDRIRADDFDSDTLTKAEYARLLVGTLIVVNNLQERIKAEQSAIQGYKTDVIPKLQRIIDEAENDEKATALANEIFVISDLPKTEETQVIENN